MLRFNTYESISSFSTLGALVGPNIVLTWTSTENAHRVLV